MSTHDASFDVIVIGSGPAGQKAAVQSAKKGKRVAIIEQDRFLGGACVHRGMIPSKTLSENALRVKKMRENASLCRFELGEDTEVAALLDRLGAVIDAHDGFLACQIERNGIVRLHGRAHLRDPKTVALECLNGDEVIYSSKSFVIATGSVP